MRYTIGCKIKSQQEKTFGQEINGFYAIHWRNSYGGKTRVAIVDPRTSRLIDYCIPVFSDLSKAKEFLAEVWKQSAPFYRKIYKENGWDMSDIKFYLVKVDSSNFPFKLERVRRDGKENPAMYYAFNP